MNLTNLKSLEELYKSAPISLIICDMQGMIQYLNEAACELFGYEEGELLGKYVEILVPDNLREKHRDFRSEYLKTPVFRQMNQARVLDGRHKDGRVVRVKIALNPTKMLGEEVIVATVLSREFSQESISAFRLDLESLQRACQIANVGHWRYNLKQDHLHWSEEVSRIFGFEHSSVKPSLELGFSQFHSEDIPSLEKYFQDSVESGTPFEAQLRIINSDQKLRHVRILARTEKNQSGEVITLFGSFQDVTEHVEAREFSDLLSQKLELALTGLGEGIWEYNFETQQVIFSSNCAAMLGYSRGEMPTHIKDWDALIHHEDVKGSWKEVTSSIHELSYFVDEQRVRMKRADGSYLWTDHRARVISDHAGNPVSMIALMRDVNQEKLLELEREKARLLAEQASEMKGRFLANMSHEIRTPLNSILGMIDLIDKQNIPLQANEYMKVMQSSARSLLDLVGDILDHSKIASGKISLEESCFSYRQLLEEIVDFFYHDAFSKGLKLDLIFSPVETQIYSDPKKLRQVLTNLVGNAIKFTEDGRVWIQVSKSTNGTLETRVGDTGRGIKKENLESVFEAFTQEEISNSRSYEGTGLGLSISRDLIKALGGEMSVQSTPGVGSEFCFHLPSKILSCPIETHEFQFPEWNYYVVSSCDYLGSSSKALLNSFGRECVHIHPENQVPVIYHETESTNLIFLDSDLAKAAFEITEFKKNLGSDTQTVLVCPRFMAESFEVARNRGMNGVLHYPIRTTELVSLIKSLAGAAPGSEEHSINEDREDESSIQFTGMKVMVVDDNFSNLYLSEIYLQNLGVEVYKANSGRDALKAVTSFQPDLIFMDCQMPGMDGYETTLEIRKLEEWNTIPIIALTANAFESEKQACEEVGMNDFLTKPVTEEVFIRVLAQYSNPEIERAKTKANPECDQALGMCFQEKFPVQFFLREYLESMQNSLGDDYESTMRELARLFLADTQSDFFLLQNLIKQKNFKRVKKTAHKIKGACANFGLDDLKNLLSKISHSADSSSLNEEDLKELIEKFEAVSNHLEGIV